MRKIKELYPVPKDLHFYSLKSFFNRINNEIEINQSSLGSKITLKFPGYEKEENKNIIRKLANDCCSYCGMRVGTYTITVEHYRPKARLDFLKKDCFEKQFKSPLKNFSQESRIHNYGYFLWGDDSRNLFPSCGACNTGQCSNGVYVGNTIQYNIPYGKKNFFPILVKNNSDWRKNLLYIKNIMEEKALLFNPYYDDPEELFIYKEYNSPNCHVKIKVNPYTTKLHKLKAMTTINLLGLNRRYLCDQRYLILKSYKTLLKSFAEAIKYPKDEIFWKNLVYEYADLFNEESGSFLGYVLHLENKVNIGNKIEDYIIGNFSPNGIIKTHIFADLINQFRGYGQKMDDSIEFLSNNIRLL